MIFAKFLDFHQNFRFLFKTFKIFSRSRRAAEPRPPRRRRRRRGRDCAAAALLTQRRRVEVYACAANTRSWALDRRGSPGNLQAFEDECLRDADLSADTSPVIVAVRVGRASGGGEQRASDSESAARGPGEGKGFQFKPLNFPRFACGFQVPFENGERAGRAPRRQESRRRDHQHADRHTFLIAAMDDPVRSFSAAMAAFDIS